MYIIVFAALFGLIGITSGMECDDPVYEQDHKRNHCKEKKFIESSNTPLTIAASLNNCGFCMALAAKQSEENVSYWESFKRFMSGTWKPSDDMRFAIWQCVSNRSKTRQLYALLNRVQYYSDYYDYYYEGATPIEALYKIKRNGRSLFFQAVACHNLAAVTAILSNVPRCDKQNMVNERSYGDCVYSGHNPLMVAVHKCIGEDIGDKEKIVQILLDQGAQVNVRELETHIGHPLIKPNDPPLLLARSSRVVDMLIDHGAYVDDKDSHAKNVFDVLASCDDINSSTIGALIKKVLIKGALRPMKHPNNCIQHFILGCQECGSTLRATKERINLELTLKELVKRFKSANLPRDIQIKILRCVDWFPSFYSKATLSIFGDRIEPELCGSFFWRVPESVIASVARSLDNEPRHAFANKFIPVLIGLRVYHLTHQSIHDVCRQKVPEYFSKGTSFWSSPQARADLQNRYEIEFGLSNE